MTFSDAQLELYNSGKVGYVHYDREKESYGVVYADTPESIKYAFIPDTEQNPSEPLEVKPAE